jgi:hypothetical protein
MRADYRGEGKISIYQIMASVACLYSLLIAYIFNRTPAGTPDLALGLATIWNPAVLIFLLTLWVATLFYMGKSRVTNSLIEIHVLRGKI